MIIKLLNKEKLPEFRKWCRQVKAELLTEEEIIAGLSNEKFEKHYYQLKNSNSKIAQNAAKVQKQKLISLTEKSLSQFLKYDDFEVSIPE